MYNARQNSVLDFIKRNPNTGVSAIVAYISTTVSVKSSKPTISRDLEKLLRDAKIVKTGNGRATTYSLAIDVNEYFEMEPDKRNLKFESFNFNVWNEMKGLFSKKELVELDALNEQYRKNKSGLSPTAFKKELERLTIEFAWKSSKIEGNTYTLLDTERLIKDKVEAEGKSAEEATMILNHKIALDFIFSKPEYFQIITIAKIEHIHKLLTGELEIESGIRQRKVGIIGTNYRPLDNMYQIKESLEKLALLINELKHPLSKALAAVLMISYIQPFEDGNKRTARTVGNALLLAFNYCPLSYRSADDVEYKKGIILFYEQNDFKYFKQIFIGQFKDAVKKYF
jgi:Fic family protein